MQIVDNYWNLYYSVFNHYGPPEKLHVKGRTMWERCVVNPPSGEKLQSEFNLQ